MLKAHIESALTQALKSGDELRLSVLRLLLAALHNREIERRTKSGEGRDIPLTEEEVLHVIRGEVKKRRDAIEAYERGGRVDAAARERQELAILSTFLPPELSDEELTKIVRDGQAATGAATEKDFGALMGWVMGQVKGRASGERVSAIVRKVLATL